MAGDDWKYVATGTAVAGIVSLIALAYHNSKKSEWEREKAQLHYQIRTLNGELISEREYTRRLDAELEQLKQSLNKRGGQIIDETDALIAEVESMRNEIREDTELFSQLSSILTRVRNVRQFAELRNIGELYNQIR